MQKGYLLGVDIGTYSSKGALVSTDGKVVEKSSIPHEVSIPNPGWMEHDADDVWMHDFLFIVKDLAQKNRDRSKRNSGYWRLINLQRHASPG